MTKDVYITVTGTLTDEEGHETSTETRVQGQYFFRGECRYLLYKEPDPSSETDTDNILKIRDGLVELRRSGAIRSRMLFETGKTHTAVYMTPYGSLPLEVRTEEIRCFWSDNIGSLSLCYCLLSEGILLSQNRISIKIRNFSGKD